MTKNTTKETTKALSSKGASRIKQEDVYATLASVSANSNIPHDDLVLLGSTGKQPTSGDIDVALSIHKYPPEAIHNIMMSHYSGVLNKGNKIGSYLIPISNSESFVQLDLMFVDDIEWAKFAYFSAGTNSEYKGAVRTLLLMGVVAATHIPCYTYFKYEDPNDVTSLIYRVGLTFDLNNGIRTTIKERRKRTDGSYNKTFSTIDVHSNQAAEVLKVNNIKPFVYLTQNKPQESIQLMFMSEDINPESIETAEQVVALIKSTFSPIHAEEIFKFTSQRAWRIRNKMKFPREVTKFFTSAD